MRAVFSYAPESYICRQPRKYWGFDAVRLMIRITTASKGHDMSDALYLAAGYKTPKQAEFEIRPLAEMERIYIETVITYCEGSIPRAAALLDVSPSTIYRKKSQWDA